MARKSKKNRLVKGRGPSKNASRVSEADDDILPDAWERFERAVDAAAKYGPAHKAIRPKPPNANKVLTFP
jgi:hypothetical protein